MSGSRTGRPSGPVGFDCERAVVAIDDDVTRGGKPEAGSGPHVLRREERVEDPVDDGRRDTGPVVRDVHVRAALVASRADRDGARLAERVDRVREQVRPHLIQLRAAHDQPRQVAVVVADDLDRGVLQAVAEHDQRRLETFVEVDVDQLATIHVGVGLDGSDKARHAPRGLLQLRGEAARGQGGGDPAERCISRRAGQRPPRGPASPRRRRRRPAARRGATARARRATRGVRAAHPRRPRHRARRAR